MSCPNMVKKWYNQHIVALKINALLYSCACRYFFFLIASSSVPQTQNVVQQNYSNATENIVANGASQASVQVNNSEESPKPIAGWDAEGLFKRWNQSAFLLLR